MTQRVLVTGATGFVGRTLSQVLIDSGYRVTAAVRERSTALPSTTEQVAVGDIGSKTHWSAALQGVDAVVHAAARVHIMNAKSSDADLYYETNARGTARLAEAAASAGVRRFVYLSSVKVNGEETSTISYGADDEPRPMDDYARSKLCAEQALRAMTPGPVCFAVIRPTLVYGPGVRANFVRLMRWVDRKIPLPLGAVDNRRSLVNVWNLCDLVRLLLEREHQPFRTWMVSDDEDLSTPELIRRIAQAMGRPARLPSVPVPMLRALGSLLGKQAEVHRLCSSLTVDVAKTRIELGWAPPVSVDEGLRRTVQWYCSKERKGAA